MTMNVSSSKPLFTAIIGTLALCAVSLSPAQQAKLPTAAKQDTPDKPSGKPQYGEFNMSTKLGSFKMLEYNDDGQPEGHFEMNFTGTVLIDTSEATKHPRGLTTTIKAEGAVIKELSYHGRVVYHGTGKLIVDGGWHALQWFGRDLTAKFNGHAVFRLAGEFDKDLETGYYWYSDGKKNDWGTGGNQPTCPKTVFGVQTPKIKINGKGG